MYGCSTGKSCCGSSLERSFLTKEERLEMLQEYKETLDKESTGVSERIKELKAEK